MPIRHPLGALLVAASAGAQALPTQTWSEAAASPERQITSVSPFGTALALDGARATVFYNDGSSRSALFSARIVGPDAAAFASDAHFTITADSSLSASFPAFSIINTDSALTLVGFRIDGRGDGAGKTAFDRDFGGTGTDGSSTGVDLTLDFTGRTFLTGTVSMTYSNPIGLAGAAPVGDLFSTVDVRMNLGTVIGLPPTTSFGGAFSSIKFNTDVDTVVYATPVPEPASALLMLLGTAALGAHLRRRPRTG